MQDISKKVAYLQGLMDGLEIDASSKEGRIIVEIIKVLEEMADELKSIKAGHEELENYVETIDDGLYDLEEEIYENNDSYDDEDKNDYIEVECPECHDTVYFDADILDDEDLIEVTCPNCETVVFVNDQEFEAVVDKNNSNHEDDEI
ncbi:AraC family transcriptional regulator [Bacillota bacterium LX-D]|nr:AraC family transcriptional regulator [Bacillota bacterium LX-D]